MPFTIGNDLRRGLGDSMLTPTQFIVDGGVVQPVQDVIKVIGSGVTDAGGVLTIFLVDTEGQPVFADLNNCTIIPVAFTKAATLLSNNVPFAAVRDVDSTTGRVRIAAMNGINTISLAGASTVPAIGVKINYEVTGIPA